MKIYLVGGAVRDKLLGLKVKERDWVVVGATPDEMLALNFRKVGKDFPVFLHPKTHEEYALARTERKTGKGYTNFVCYADKNVTLEEDLKRRDLTINAMAQTKNGKLIDPYNGLQDLKKHILRHVSEAFAEDPVRILRLARFAARFPNFKVHPTTNKLMRQMLVNGEVDALVPERVWQELERALGEKNPERFFVVLKNCGVLQKLFPEISGHFSAIKKNLVAASNLTQNKIVRFGALIFALSKDEIKNFGKKYHLPGIYLDLALLINKLKKDINRLSTSSFKNTDKIITILEQADTYRRPARFQQLVLGYTACGKKLKMATDILSLAYKITKNVKLTPKILSQENKNNLRYILHKQRNELLNKKLHTSLLQKRDIFTKL